jgi:carboxyl-terminal processing protease
MKALTTAFLTFIGAILLFGLGFSIRDIERGRLPDLSAAKKLVGAATMPQPEQILNHNFNLIRNDYYRDVKPTPLRYAAMTGMIASLGDPHTMFLPPKEKEDFEFQTTQELVGIGSSLDTDPRGVVLREVFDDSPASRAGLQAGDVIVSVDGTSIKGIARTAVVTRIRGIEGTTVRLGVLHGGKGTPKVVAVKRARVAVPTVTSFYFPDSKIGYLDISTFAEPTVDQFDSKISKLQQQGLNGLVIDLRGDPGGLLDTATSLLGRFEEDKVVVKMRHRDGTEELASTPSGYKLDLQVPIVILVNEDSASASEIFAGCMRDYGLAKLVGTHSYGKSSVQHIFPMLDSAGVKVTIAKYYLPVTPYYGRQVDSDGTYISGGLIPDYLVKEDPNITPQLGKPTTDAQLAKAIEVLKSERP